MLRSYRSVPCRNCYFKKCERRDVNEVKREGISKLLELPSLSCRGDGNTDCASHMLLLRNWNVYYNILKRLGHQIILFARDDSYFSDLDELLRTYNIDKPKPRFSTYKSVQVDGGAEKRLTMEKKPSKQSIKREQALNLAMKSNAFIKLMGSKRK